MATSLDPGALAMQTLVGVRFEREAVNQAFENLDFNKYFGRVRVRRNPDLNLWLELALYIGGATWLYNLYSVFLLQ